MLAAEHLHTNALLVVLITSVLAVAALRATAHFLERKREARDREMFERAASVDPLGSESP